MMNYGFACCEKEKVISPMARGFKFSPLPTGER